MHFQNLFASTFFNQIANQKTLKLAASAHQTDINKPPLDSSTTDLIKLLDLNDHTWGV